MKRFFATLAIFALIALPLVAQGTFTATGVLVNNDGGTVSATLTGVTGQGGAAVALSIGGCLGSGTLHPRGSGQNPNGTTWTSYSGEIPLCDGSKATIRLILGNSEDPVAGTIMLVPAGGGSASSGSVT